MRCRNIFAVLYLTLFVGMSAQADLTDVYQAFLDLYPSYSEDAGGLAGFPILAIPMGGSQQAMAGSTTAVSDPLGFLDANPASSVSGSGLQMAFAHREWVASGAIETMLLSTTFESVGLSTGTKLFYTPFTAYDDGGVRTGSGYFIEYVGAINLSLRLIERPRLGLDFGSSAKIAGRHVSREIAANQSAVAFPFDFGFLFHTTLADFSQKDRRNVFVGATLKDVGPATASLDAPLPTTLNGGIGYSPISAMLMTFDVALPMYFPSTGLVLDTLGYSAGLRLALARFLRLEAGAQFQSQNLRIALGGTALLEGVDISAAYSVDVLSGFNPLDTVSIMAILKLGKDGP